MLKGIIIKKHENDIMATKIDICMYLYKTKIKWTFYRQIIKFEYLCQKNVQM